MWHPCAAGQSPLCPTCPGGPGGTDKGGHHSHRVLTDSGQLLGVPRSTQKSAVRLPRDMASHTQIGTPVQVKLAMMSWFSLFFSRPRNGGKLQDCLSFPRPLVGLVNSLSPPVNKMLSW